MNKLDIEHIKEFSYKFFEQNFDSDNPVLSPASAYIALSVLALGANSSTYEEFENVLGADMGKLAGDIIDLLSINSKELKVLFADSVWISKHFMINQSWLDKIDSIIGAEAIQAELSSPEIVESINNWIERHTNGLITEMITEPFSVKTVLVIFNTVYFKAKWEFPFDAQLTYEDKFTLYNGKTILVPMMHKNNVSNIEYVSNKFVEGLIFPYKNTGKNNNFAMIALKSCKKINKYFHSSLNIREVYKMLTNKVIDELLEARQTRLVNIMLPKFEITFYKDLKESLKNMELIEVFDAGRSDLSLLGATKNNDSLYVDLICQKAKIIVDEDKTEAAAVTEIAIRCYTGRVSNKPIEVFFNEPFIYIIMEMNKKVPLFIGIIDNPSVI